MQPCWTVLSNPDASLRMGEAGRIALRGSNAAAAARKEWDVLEEARLRFRRQA